MPPLDLKQGGFAAVTLNTKGQTLEGVHKIVATALGMVGCGTCGRIARLRVDFLGDPPPGLASEHVISYVTGGFGR